MKPEDQRIAIAESCGTLKRTPIYEHRYGPGPMKVVGYGVPKSPDYLNDLNAIHEAEKALNENQWEDYIKHVKIIVGNESWPTDPGYYIHATAMQRTEAFLRTIGKWVQS